MTDEFRTLRWGLDHIFARRYADLAEPGEN